MHYIQKFGLDEHIKRCKIADKQQYVLSLRGRIAFVLQTTPNDSEFLEYKKILAEKRL